MGEVKTKKVGIFRRIGNAIKATGAEFKKVVWPTKKQLINHTIVVISFVIITGVFVCLLDIGLTALIKLFF